MKKGLILITLPITLPLAAVGLGVVAFLNGYGSYKRKKATDKQLKKL